MDPSIKKNLRIRTREQFNKPHRLLSAEAKVADLDDAKVASEQEILKFEVAMSNAEVMYVGHGGGDLHRPGPCSVLAQSTC